MKHKLESRLKGKISIISDMQIIPPYGRKRRRTKEPLDENERGEWQNWLKTQHSNTNIMASGPITSWQIDGETMETLKDFIFLGSNITANGDCSHEIKRCLLLGRKVMTYLDSILKRRGITLQTKFRIVKAMFFSVVMYGWEKAMAIHSIILAWRILGTEELGGLLSMGSHRVGHDWHDLAAAAACMDVNIGL